MCSHPFLRLLDPFPHDVIPWRCSSSVVSLPALGEAYHSSVYLAMLLIPDLANLCRPIHAPTWSFLPPEHSPL